MHFVICCDNVYGEPEPLEDSSSGETEKFATINGAFVEAARLNEFTEGGYYVCRQVGCALERVRP